MDFEIDPEFAKLIPPLTPEEYELLEASILRDGCRDPLVVWSSSEPPADHKCYNPDPAHYADGTQCSLIAGDGVWTCDTCGYNPAPFVSLLLDGHNRYEICQRHGIPFETVEIDLEDRDTAADWIEANQLGRRNLPPHVWKILIGRRYNRTKKTTAEAGAMKGKSGGQNVQSFTTAEAIAEQHGVTERTVRRAGKMAEEFDRLEKAAPEEAKAVFNGTRRFNEVRREIRHEEAVEQFPFMQGPDWKQSQVLAIREDLEHLSEEEQKKISGVVECATILHPTDAVKMVSNLVAMKPADRQQVFRLSESEDPRDKTLALTTAMKQPPNPDPRLNSIQSAIESLGRASKPFPKDPLTPRIEASITELRAILAAVKAVSFDARRTKAAEGTVQ